MKKLFIIFILFYASNYAIAGDTTFYPTGEIRTIYKRGVSRIDYYRNGKVEAKCKYSSLFRKGRMVDYDSTGNIISKGKTVFGLRKQGRWKEYKNDKKYIVRYKYGIKKSELRTSEGKRVKCLLTYGLGAGWNNVCDPALTKYRIRYVAIAGCIVNNEVLFKSALHNIPVYFGKVLRYGFKWEDKMDEMCDNKKGF